MGHLLEEYAKNLGVKISTPISKDHFFPLTVTKYITISQIDSQESKTYPHYELVINLLKPFLDRANIKVVQLGGKSQIRGADIALNLTFKQQSYIISNSLVHLGSDGILSHVASSKNIPTVNLFGNTFPSANRPIFSRSSLNVNLCPEWDKKPCFADTDPNKQINNIRAEVIAQSVLDFLKIEKEEIRFKTKHIGNAFLQSAVELIPTSFHPIRLPTNQLLLVRADYGIESNAFMEYCSKYKVAISSSQLIQPKVLEKIGANVSTLFVFLDSNWDQDIPPSYFQLIKNLNIELVFLLKDESKIFEARNRYFDIPVRPYNLDKDAPCKVGKTTKFLSGLRLLEGTKEYLSYAHWKKGLDNNNQVLDTPEYWRELDHFYIYESE